jgi:DNA-binding cell septation regulator SpoVG
MNDEKVEVLELRLLNGGKPLKAFCDLEIGDWIVRDFRVVKQNGGRILIDVPQVTWKNQQTGELRFKGILTLPSELKQEIDVAVLRAYWMEVEKQNGLPQPV